MNRPLALVCFICGRQFGTKSLVIHIKTCQKKWQNQQNLLDPNKRRPCPKAPKGFMQLISKPNITRKDIQNFNVGSFDTFMDQALVQCEYCGRKFNEKSLAPHQKACKTNPMIRKPYVSKQQKIPMDSIGGGFSKKSQYPVNMIEESQQKMNANLQPCRKCGRTFNADRVAKHQKVCKQTKKPVANKPTSGIIGSKNTKFQQVNSVNSPNTKPSMLKKKSPFQKQPKWKVQHQQLQKAMKQMRKIKRFQQNGGNLKDLPPPPPSNYDHYVQCKHCGRKYAAEVAERHIPKCANIINKPGGIKTSKIQEKYVGSSGVKKVETPLKPQTKSYQLTKATKPSSMKPVFQPETEPLKPNVLKPNMKSSWGNSATGLKKKW